MKTQPESVQHPAKPLYERPEVLCSVYDTICGSHHVESAPHYGDSEPPVLDESAERVHDWSWWKNQSALEVPPIERFTSMFQRMKGGPMYLQVDLHNGQQFKCHSLVVDRDRDDVLVAREHGSGLEFTIGANDVREIQVGGVFVANEPSRLGTLVPDPSAGPGGARLIPDAGSEAAASPDA